MTEHTDAQQPVKYTLEAQPGGPKVDPRGPRFGANITWVLLLVTIFLNLIEGPAAVRETLGARLAQPSVILLIVIAALFAWGAFAGVERHPYGLFFKNVIRPKLGAPDHFENPKPPTFAQLVGFVFAAVGLVLGLAGVPYGLLIPVIFAFIAAFLNGVFGYCMGCEMFLLLARAKLVRL